MAKVREAQFAGSWYPAAKEDLTALLEEFMAPPQERQPALGIVSPHAGYTFSGAVAGAVYARVQVTDTVVVMAVNHTGWGAPVALWDAGSWITPLGEVPVDDAFAQRLLDACSLVQADTTAHVNEHSGELQVPFLQYVNPDVKIVPLVVHSSTFEPLEELGKALAGVIRAYGQPVLVVASSDMTHYEPDSSARQKDNLAIGQILELDPRGLWDVVHQQRISMCGFAPVSTMLVCVKELGAGEAKLVKYQTSGDVIGDRSSVVGYAGIMVM